MPLTSEQLAKISEKEASLPDALHRHPLTDYYEGYFFVTLNTRGESPILSTIRGHVGGIGANAPHCEYTELGGRVKQVIASIPQFHKHVEVIDAEVMPEHLHMLLYLHAVGKQHLGKVISGFMSGCTHAYWDTLGIDWRKDHPTQGRPAATNGEGSATALQNGGKSAAALRKPDRDRDHTRSYRGPALFVRGYNDVEPITEEEVQIKIAYIRSQAEKRLIKGERHECFQIHRHQHSRNWTKEAVIRAIAADPSFARYANKQEATAPGLAHFPNKMEVATTAVLARLNTDGKGAALDYIGKREWLGSAKKLPLVCHRADAQRFEEQKAAVIKAAREGWIIVSAFISPAERDIKQQLMVEQLPFVEIMDNGFSGRYKPTGKAFYACAENRLVQISCWSYEYQLENRISREMCLVMNELARTISGRADNWWKR